MNFKKLLFISTILFIVFYFSPISINFNELPVISKIYAVSNINQSQLDQTASILSSIQSIINKLKTEIQSLFNREAQAATETIGLVRQDCTGYSNCFTSLYAWETAYGGINFGACAQGDLVCADKIAVAQIDGVWTSPDTTTVIINGWTTNAPHYIKIYTTTAARHSGKWDNNKYRLQTNDGDKSIYIAQSHVIIDGLQIKQLSDNSGIFSNGPYAGTGQVIRNNIIWGSASWTTARNGIYWVGTASDVAVYNNIVYGFTYTGSYGINLEQFPQTITPYTYNNTVYGNANGILADSDAYLSNNLSFNNTTADFSGTPKTGSGWNISKDGTAPGSNSLTNQTVSQVAFVSTAVGSEDFHIQSNSSARDTGTDLLAIFTTDIDGNTRPVGSAWDIGADEEPTVAPPPPSDTTPPVLSSGSPTGALPSGTTQTTLSVSTIDENATCKYGTTPNTAYTSIANTFTTTGGTSHSQTITGLTNGTSYNYYVRCQDATGNANTTDYTISFSVSAPAGDTTPSTISITSPTSGTTVSGTITITANATDNVGVAGAQFKLNNSNIGTEDTTSPYSYSLNTTTITDGSHTLLAVARDTSNNYATSSAITITVNNTSPPPPDITAPSIPTNLAATAISSSQINLSWTASTDNVGVAGYKIYRCQGTGCAPITQITTLTTNSYSNTGLTASTTYTYTVSAYDAAGNESGKSAVVSATTQSSTGIIFEDNFDYTWTPPSGYSYELYPCTKDTGGSCAVTQSGTYPVSAQPVGQRTNSNSWNGWSFPGGGYDLRTVTGKGRNGSEALKIVYPAGSDLSSEPRLIKYLGYPGYNEIYIRWYFKFEDTGPEKWVWGDGTTASFSFMKLGRFFQGVNLNSLRPRYTTSEYYVHPTSYPGFVIPDWGNAGPYGNRKIIPVLIPTAGNNQTTMVDSYSLWVHYYKNHWPYLNINATISPNDGTTNHVIGPIYQPGESGIPGEMKYPQDYHSLEMHFKLRELAESGSAIPATYVSDWSFKVSGDQTSTLTPGTLWKANNTGQWNGWNSPVLHEVKSSSFANGETTVVLVQQASLTGPHLTSTLTTVVKMIETSPGVIEEWIDGVAVGNYQSDFSNIINSNALANHTLDGGFSYLIISDNIWMNRTHPITMYIDDFAVSTTRIGSGAMPSPDTTSPATPTNLTATPISPSQINLSWTASTDNVGVAGYKIYRCAGTGCAPTIQIATSNTNSYSNTGLTASTAYTYAVSAYDFSGNESAKSFSVSATTQSPTPQCSDGIDNDNDGKIDFGGANPDPDCSSLTDNSESDTTPPIISNVISTTLASTTARINWTTNEPSTSQVEYGFTTQYGASTTLSSILATSHSVFLSNLSADNTTYNYRVRSKDASGNESISTNNTFITPGLTDIIPPASTTNLTANNITQTSVDLVTWTAAGDDGNTGTAYQFDIRYSATELTENNWNDSSVIRATGEPTPKPAGSLMNYTLLGLTPNTTYKVALKTLDEILNQSLISNIITFTTLAAQSTPQTTSQTTAPSSGSGGSSSSISGGGSTSSGGGGGGGGSFILSDTTPPPLVTNLESEGSDKQTRLTWNNPESTDWVRTIIVRKELTSATSTHATSVPSVASAKEGTKDGTIIYEGTDKEFTDIKLKNNQTYLYSIFTIDRVPNYSPPATTTARTIEGKTSIEVSVKEQEASKEKETAETTESIPSKFQILKGFFKRTLKQGMKGEDVKMLQKALFQNKEEYYKECVSNIQQTQNIKTKSQNDNSKLKNKEQDKTQNKTNCSEQEIITGYFGKTTKLALIRFQEKYKEDILKPAGLISGTGYFGKATIKKIEALYGQNLKSKIINPKQTAKGQTEKEEVKKKVVRKKKK